MYEDLKAKMEKAITALESDYTTIRAGRANPGILDKVMVDYYGVATPVPQVGTVSVPEPRTLMVQPWDASILHEVEKAILKADIGLTEERRKELVKAVSKRAEEAKVVIRGIRRDALETFKAQKKNGEITEDDLKDIEKDVQDLTDKYIKEIDSIAANKDKEIMEV